MHELEALKYEVSATRIDGSALAFHKIYEDLYEQLCMHTEQFQKKHEIVKEYHQIKKLVRSHSR